MVASVRSPGSIGVDQPPGAKALMPRSSTPPASSSRSDTGVASGTSKLPGLLTAPDTLHTRVPGERSVPHCRYHSAPLNTTCPAACSDCTLLTTVGDAYRPSVTGN